VVCSLKETSVSNYHGSVEGFADTAAAMEGKKLNVARMLCFCYMIQPTLLSLMLEIPKNCA
jgi:hypothetical protein